MCRRCAAQRARLPIRSELLDRAVGSAVESVRGIVRAERLSLLGAVAARQPMVAEENIEEYIAVPELAGGGDGEYLLQIRGESMKTAGILEGDYVVVHSQDTANDGDVVVALVGEEATVKRYFREADHIRLQPENEAREPIRSKEVKVLGRVSSGCCAAPSDLPLALLAAGPPVGRAVPFSRGCPRSATNGPGEAAGHRWRANNHISALIEH
jgi:SOS-response transcriptional repressor LexA